MTEKQNHQPHLLLIDGYGFLFRAYHSLPPLTRKDGTPVGAVLGFTNMLMKMISSHKVDYIAVVFDAGRKTFRHALYPEYKANRPPAPDDLIPQFSLVREAATALNVHIIEMNGYEADDIIATYARLSREKSYKLTIVSSDKDLMQLIGDDGVQMYDPMKNKIIGIPEVQEKFGVKPDKVLDVLSLMGDSSDNIPGVPGIGPKTAAELVLQFGSLDEVLKRAGEIKQNKRRETIIENADKALLSRSLITLCATVPLEMENDFSPLEVKEIDYQQFYEFLHIQGFKSLIAKIEGKIKVPPSASAGEGSENKLGEKTHPSTIPNSLHKPGYEIIKPTVQSCESILITNLKTLKEFIDKQKEIKMLAIYFDIADGLRGVAININNSTTAYIKIAQENNAQQGSLFGDVQSTPSLHQSNRETLAAITPLLVDKTILKIGHDLKETYKLLLQNNIVMQPFDDIMLMSYVMGAGAHGHGLQELTDLHLANYQIFNDKELIKMTDENRSIVMCDRVFAISYLHAILKPKLFKERCLTLYETLEKPMLTSLAQMELLGICLDAAKLKEQSRVFAGKISALQQHIYQAAGCEFNIASPKQMGEVLFGKMSLASSKKSKKSGAQSTNVQVLNDLAEQGHEIASLILDWRHFSKLKSTYTDALPNQVGADGRVHTHFLMASTNTGRLSSIDPNLQNIPARSEEGNRIREAFIASRGCKLISADYSQIELRLLAEIANIEPLKTAFKKGIDIHAVTASQMFGVAVESVTSELRRRAKTINFGIIYGISAFGLAQRLNIGRKEAADYIKKYFLQYPGIEEYMKDTVEFVRTHGYVQTLFGRKCYIKGINDKNAAIRQFSERAAINAPLQGSAADIIKKSMVRLHARLENDGLQARILLQVHDELIIETPEQEAEMVMQIARHEMESAVTLEVSLKSEAGIGDNWSQAH